MDRPSVGEHVFKTVYFPRERVRTGSSTRVTVSVPTKLHASPEFFAFVNQLSSRDFRLAIGDPFVEDLEDTARNRGESFSNICVRMLQDYFTRQTGRLDSRARKAQLPLPFDSADAEPPTASEPSRDLGVTFRESLRQHVFGWYPYVEGFSATYTRDAILRYSPRAVYDPFGGSGTTQLAAACLGIPSFYSEVNPFMCFVADTKVGAARWARGSFKVFHRACDEFIKTISGKRFDRLAERIDLSGYEAAFPERDFFEERHIRHLLAAVDVAREAEQVAPEMRDLLLLACAANAVSSSNMTRRADLRRRRPDEYKERVVDVPTALVQTVRRFVSDVEQLPSIMASVTRVSNDARALPPEYNNAFDFALTSPPYLNGTNYFRNTKIELWLLAFIKSEEELGAYRKQAIAAGINNVTRGRQASHTFDDVEAVVAKLNATDGDRRIAVLVRQYHSDMFELFSAVRRGLTPGGTFLLDIGDSKFYGVHVPTDRLLVDVAAKAGLTLKHRHVLARRHSRDKSELVQVELVFQKGQHARGGRPRVGSRQREASAVERSTAHKLAVGGPRTLEEAAAEFQRTLPYKQAPYDSRAWGHDLHSLCSYQGKLKPAMAHWLVHHFVRPGGRVLDPLGGVGTIPFEAALQGHESVSNDKSPFAATVAKAKLAPPSLSDAEHALRELWREVEGVPKRELDYASTAFGLNGTVADFFHEKTLEEILRARAVFLTRKKVAGPEAFLWASLLHVLHGNRPYALSRTSHPITPFHPKGPAVYKNVREKIWNRVVSALNAERPASFQPGRGIEGDFRALDANSVGRFDAIITSPPFLGMRFDRPNWLRLWFCGWGETDFHKTSLGFLERQQTKSTDVYREFFSTMRGLITPNGVLIVHIGSGKGADLVSDLRRLGEDSFILRAEVRENVQAVEQHGIRDKGLTTHHHLLFLTPR